MEQTIEARDVAHLGVLLAIALFAGWVVFLLWQTSVEEKSVLSQCFAAGYPEIYRDRHLFSPNQYYCSKRVNGSDVMVEFRP